MKRSVTKSGGKSKPDWLPLSKQAFRLYEQGQYDEAISIAMQACELARQLHGADHTDYATSLNNLGVLYAQMSNYAAAEPLYRQALEIRRTALGEDHPAVAQCLSNLAGLYYYMGNYAESAPLYRQALDIKRKALGEDHPDYVASLNSLAGLYRYIGNDAAAEPLLRQALDIQRAALGENHPDYATSLNNLAVLYQMMGDYTAAEPLVRQALDIQRAALGENHPDYATSLNNLAVLYTNMRNYAAAEPLVRQALDIQRAALGENHPDYATSLNNLAELYRAMGNDAVAEPLLHQASDIWRAALGENNPNYATSLNNLGRLYQTMGNYAAAEPLLRQALEIRRTVLGESHPEVAQSLNNLMELYMVMGNHAAKEALYRQALEIRRKTLGKEDPNYIASLDELAGLNMEIGNYGEAERLYLQALEIIRKTLGEDHLTYATSLNGLGVLYHAIANFTDAERLLHQALEIQRRVLGEDHPAVAQTLSNLAVLYTQMYNNKHTYGFTGWTTALPLFNRALEITRKTLGEEHPDYANRLDNLAWLHMDVGHYAEAERLFIQALKITGAALGEDHPAYATRLNSLSVLYSSLGNHSMAERLLSQAREIWRKTLGENHPSYVSSLINLLKLYAAMDREVEAIELMVEAANIQDQIMGQVFSISSETHRIAYIKDLQADLNLFLSLIFQCLRQLPDVASIALDLVLRRKAIGVEALATQREVVMSGRYPALEPPLRKLVILRTQIARKTLAGPDETGGDALRAHKQLLVTWNTEKEQLEADLARQIPEMNYEQHFHDDWENIAKSLPTNAVLVEFVRYEVFDFRKVPAQSTVVMEWDHTLQRWDAGQNSRYIAFVLIADEPNNMRMLDLGASGSIDRMIAEFRAAATGGERALTREPEKTQQTEDITSGTALREALFDPLLEALGNRTRLFLAPDGDLSQLPFEALPLNDGRRIIDVYQISYLSTGRDVLRFTKKTNRAPEQPVVFADPAFDLDAEGSAALSSEEQPISHQSNDLDRSGLRFNRLNGARKEGEQVGARLGVRPLLAESALEGTLKSLRSPRILHLATHGFFLPDQPRVPNPGLPNLEATGGRLFGQRLENPLLRSGLALAGANSWLQGKTLRPEAEDGLLTAEDVTGLDLLDTELVVLSACDTGRGEVHVGEGVFGLRRAFVLAGAKTLVMSLWKVPDQATRELMVDFYKRLLKGTPRAEALRQAQLAIKKKNPHPRFWGAFICQGDPGPLSEHRSAEG